MDGIEVELFFRRFVAVAEEMGEVLQLTAFSPNIKERRDHSCAVFDAAGDTIAQAAHIPVHLGAAPASVKAVIGALELRDGEHALVNDPYAGGTHLPDITLVSAVDLDGERFYVASRAHHADVGGIAPGSLPPSRVIEDEGWRCPPTLMSDALVSSLLSVSRTPDERRGDFAAQLAANRSGQKRLRELAERHGARKLTEAAAALQDYTERRTMALLEEIPMREIVVEDVLDGTFESREAVPIRLRMKRSGSRLSLDFRDSAPQVVGPMNAVRAIVESAVFHVLLCLFDDTPPPNAGVMRCCDILTRPGTVVDATYPAAVAAGNVETSQRIVDVLLQAFGQLLPERVAAPSCGSMNNVLIGARQGDPHQWVYYETLAGGCGAGPRGAGASATHAHMTNTWNTPIEALEHAFPMRIEVYRVRRGSGGKGAHRGGDGLVRAWRFLGPATVTLIGERRVFAPPGAAGGGDAMVGSQYVIRSDGGRQMLEGKAHLDVEAGDLLVVETPGGGGWGAPG